VVLADRDELYLEALSRAVKRQPDQELVGTGKDGFAALGLIRSLLPGVAVLDPTLPGLDGLRVLHAIERDQLPTRVVMLCAEPEERRPHDALAAGARGYLTRYAGEQEICAAITAAGTGGAVISARLHPGVVAEICRRSSPGQPRLDERASEVIELTAAGFSPSEIALQLYLSVSTVKSRLHCLYKALGVSAPTAAVAEALRRHLID
jgi:two-component system nitrate/nitrite response regulator NarL